MNNPFSLEGKIVLVTGSSSNIGRKIAMRCSEMGARIIVVARDEERMKATVSGLAGKGHKYYAVDLSNAELIANLIEEVPMLDGVVLCAARFDSTPVKNIKRELVQDMFNTNTFANFDIVQKLLKKKKINKGGSIVFISSVASMRPYKANSLYSATKGAINSFSKVLALELGPQKIRVNCMHPGIVRREEGIREGALTAEQQRQEMERFPLGMGETDDIAYAVVYLLSDVAKWITGIDLVVDGGQTLV